METAFDDFQVIGGERIPDGLYPATGALMTGGQPTCTGTLISPTVVLTAAHCVAPLFIGGVKHHGTADLVDVGAHELFIAEPGQQQNCNGDSGGPAFVDIDGNERLVGIVSRAPDENPTCDHGGIDTRVDPYLEWIHSQVDLPCGTGLSDPCETGPDAGSDDGPDGGGPGVDGVAGGGCCSVAGDGPAGSALLGLLVLGQIFRRRRLLRR